MSVAIVIIALCGYFMERRLRRARGISLGELEKISAAWVHAQGLPDAHRRVMEADKVLHMTFRALKIEGGLGDCLKTAGNRLPNLQAVWTAHKLRNRLAHEPGAQVTPSDERRALQAFEKALRSLGGLR